MVLDLHFLNVGHGDCTMLDFEGDRLAMIDINNTKSLPTEDRLALAERHGLGLLSFAYSKVAEAGHQTWEDYYKSLLDDPAEYHAANFAGRPIFRYIQTHPDMDHMSGLHRFFVVDRVPIMNMWDSQHAKSLNESQFSNSPYDYRDWLVYEMMRLGALPNHRENHRVLNLHQGDSGSYWDQDGIEILAPTPDLVAYCNERGDSWNNASFVLSVSYHGRRVILAGDAEKPEWDKIVATVPPEKLRCDVLKAAHHGRESGFSEAAMELMRPEFVICSVGKKPSTDASDEYRAYGAQVLSTRFHGTIRARVWMDGDIWIEDSRGARIGQIAA